MAKFYSTIMEQKISSWVEHHSKLALGHNESYHHIKLTSTENVMVLFYGLQESLHHCTHYIDKDQNAIIIEQI